jgi:hypothetical protein
MFPSQVALSALTDTPASKAGNPVATPSAARPPRRDHHDTTIVRDR